VDFDDYTMLSNFWLETACDGCGGADFNCDTNVDSFDLREFISNWLAGLE
jgi:hypothetical protein